MAPRLRNETSFKVKLTHWISFQEGKESKDMVVNFLDSWCMYLMKWIVVTKAYVQINWFVSKVLQDSLLSLTAEISLWCIGYALESESFIQSIIILNPPYNCKCLYWPSCWLIYCTLNIYTLSLSQFWQLNYSVVGAIIQCLGLQNVPDSVL